MNLVGKTLGKYQIVEEIGRGGMGAVYKGYDPALDRHVAVKVLAPHLAWERRFVTRFLREARTVARLSHPHIVSIYDVGQQDGIYYLAMAFVEGEPLSDLMAREGPLPPPRAAEILAQVADALDYAHKQGVVHRDVKPSNILVGPGGQVKLTDFGIAQAVEGTRLTATGTSLGTPEYMSPEQAEGEEADPRSDVYSLGIVLYEMLTGRVPFCGKTPLATLRLQTDRPPPPPRRFVRSLSRDVETVVLKALAKDPSARYATAGALAEALAGVTEVKVPARRPKKPATPAMSPKPRTKAIRPIRRGRLVIQRLVWPWAPAGLLAAAVIVVGLWAAGSTPPVDSEEATAPLAAQVSPSATETPLPIAIHTAIRTPTGMPTSSRTFTPTSTPSRRPTPTPTRTPRPTSTTVPTVTATASPLPTAASGGIQGQIAFGSDRDGNSEIYVMNADGSGLQRLTSHAAEDRYPAWSPDGERIAFTSERDDDPEIYVMNAAGAGVTRLTYSPDYDGGAAWSPDGNKIAFTSKRGGSYSVYVMNVDGTGQERLTDNSVWDSNPYWLPDGKRIGFQTNRDGDSEIYVMNADGTDPTNLTKHPANDMTPAWSPDGKRVAFTSDRDGNDEIYVMDADGTGQRRLTNSPAADSSPSWSPDGKYIAFHSDRDGDFEIYIMNADGGAVRRDTANDATDSWPKWSPVVSPTPGPTSTPVPPTLTPRVPTATLPAEAGRAGETALRPSDGMTMVYVSSGVFLMGSPSSQGGSDEHPQHTVYLDGFWIDRTEVTNAQYRKCVEAGVCPVPNGCDWGSPTFDDGSKADHPVVCTKWEDAVAYCQWADARLPTEAEWEKAARGTDGRTYPWGNAFDGSRLNFCDVNCDRDWADDNANDGHAMTAPVGSYPTGASPYGVLDMAGNVKEWVSDWYSETYYRQSPSRNPQGPTSGWRRGVRGGSWVDDLDWVRSAYRAKLGYTPVGRSTNVGGFRCASSTAP